MLFNNFLIQESKSRQDKIKKYRDWRDAQACLLGRHLLKKGIEEISGLELDFEYIYVNKYGKPFLKNSCLNFNISHSGKFVVCAIDDKGSIGIDIEEIKQIDFQHFKNQMLYSEWNRICNSNDKIISFFDYWTQKEAVIKAEGRGLSIPLKSFEINNYKTDLNGVKWYLKKLHIDDSYKCNIAFSLPDNADTLQIKKIDFLNIVNN